VGINAWWVSEELDFALRDSQPKAIFCDRERLERLPAACYDSMIVVAVRAEAPDKAVTWSAVRETTISSYEVKVEPDDDACIFYTSGTTGVPKGAQLTHRGCVNNLIESGTLRDLYEAPLALIGPDQMVAWRGMTAADAEGVLRQATGRR